MLASGLTVLLLLVGQLAAMPRADPDDETDCLVFGNCATTEAKTNEEDCVIFDNCAKPEDKVQNYLRLVIQFFFFNLIKQNQNNFFVEKVDRNSLN
jgi:hypothetical protein